MKLYLFFWFFLFFLFSCTNYKHVAYFEDIPDTVHTKVIICENVGIKIKNTDILSVSINTLDGLTNSILNTSSGQAISNSSVSSTGIAAANANSTTSLVLQKQDGTYKVDSLGNIEFPLLGKISVVGLTTREVKNIIQHKLSDSYKMPLVEVNLANFKVTILGEVSRPGTYYLSSENVNLFELLGLSGDLTIYGKRENLLLIRDSLNFKQMIRLNLNTRNIVSSPYFNLRQNDVVYVEPRKEKLANIDASQNRNYTIISSILAVVIIFLTRLK